MEGLTDMTTQETRLVLLEVQAERVRQEIKWGQQNHPDGTGPRLVLNGIPVTVGYDDGIRRTSAAELETWARDRCQQAERDGGDTYERILTEEWAEAIAQDDPDALRRELIQVAAVAVAWCEKLDREAVAAYGAADNETGQ